MIMRDVIKEVIMQKIEDGMGGSTPSVATTKEIICRASFSTLRVPAANEFGIAVEDVLSVISDVQLKDNAVYEFSGKKFQLRKAAPFRRLFHSTLVEVK